MMVWVRSILRWVSQEAANVDTPPINEPINPALAERIAVSIFFKSYEFTASALKQKQDLKTPSENRIE
jgi:hypothetical protein